MGNLPIEEGIHIHSENSVAYVGFAHPKQNAFPASHLEQLQHAFVSLAKKPDIHVIVLYSDPTKVFCAGASFDELLQVKTPEQGKQFFMGFSNVINAMRECPQPIIGRIHGPAIGGGVGLVSACDYALATSCCNRDSYKTLLAFSLGVVLFLPMFPPMMMFLLCFNRFTAASTPSLLNPIRLITA